VFVIVIVAFKNCKTLFLYRFLIYFGVMKMKFYVIWNLVF